MLPACFRHAGKHSGGSKLTEGDPREAEPTQECAAAAGDFATVHQTSRACVTREHGKTNVVFFCLQLETELGVFLDSFFFARIAGDPTFLSHNSGHRCYETGRSLQAQSRDFLELAAFDRIP
jgi:hypothetical protein